MILRMICWTMDQDISRFSGLFHRFSSVIIDPSINKCLFFKTIIDRESLFLLNLMLCAFCVLFISMNRFFLFCRWWIKFRLTKMRLTTTEFAKKLFVFCSLFILLKSKVFSIAYHSANSLLSTNLKRKNDKVDRTLFCIHFACFFAFFIWNIHSFIEWIVI